MKLYASLTLIFWGCKNKFSICVDKLHATPETRTTLHLCVKQVQTKVFLHDSCFTKNKHQFLVQFWCPTKRIRLGRWFIPSVKYTSQTRARPVYFSFEMCENWNLAQMSPARSLNVWRAPFPNACLFATFARECSCHYFDRPKEK